ncbi:hypothetical protein OZX73_00765 [Bifidobacterium sp. ESL0775]|uniref:hypothetical protein n=1 Tax=Bifidobacterium sp. ESL0775 TaxID=2983230 RepID=UPI0023F9F178|nr:hypothetical protein [Bifidobacterium sp. ESL0775]WEV69463.1 hypothetical protein OZX73_00765 [Bifidobacterium sp. ESL0775]
MSPAKAGKTGQAVKHTVTEANIPPENAHPQTGFVRFPAGYLRSTTAGRRHGGDRTQAKRRREPCGNVKRDDFSLDPAKRKPHNTKLETHPLFDHKLRIPSLAT